MRSFRFTQSNSSPFKGLDGTVYFGDGTATYKILLQSAEGLGIPDVEVQTQKAPFQQGESVIRTQYRPRYITLECSLTIAGTGASEVAEATAVKRALGRLLSPVGTGFMPDSSYSNSEYSTYLGKLAYASDGVTYDRFIDCVPVVCEMPNKQWDAGFYKLRVVFMCPDPTWYGADQSSVLSAYAFSGGGQFNIIYVEELGYWFTGSNDGVNLVFRSRDGMLWEGFGDGTGLSTFDIQWATSLGKLCLAGVGEVYTSTDGETWVTVVLGGASAITPLVWGEGGAGGAIGMMYGGDGGSGVYSDDLITWVTANYPSAYAHTGTYSPKLSLFVMVNQYDTTRLYVSSDGQSWVGSSALGNSIAWRGVVWSDVEEKLVAWAVSGEMKTASVYTSWASVTTPPTLGNMGWAGGINLFIGTNAAGTGIYTSPTAATWTAGTLASGTISSAPFWSKSIGYGLASRSSGVNPTISYNGSDWLSPSADDYYDDITNAGDIPTEFEIDIPVAGFETGKSVAIGDNFLWSGTGTPPSDHNLVFGTDGLKAGLVTVSTKFGSKSIKQFGVSKMANLQQGTFFSLYVSGATTNNIYVRNTGANAGAPTIRWKNRYLAV